MKSSLLVFALIGLAGEPGHAQDSVDGKPPPQSVAMLTAELRVEASKLTAVSPSKLFADLGGVNIARKLALSGEQGKLAGRLDELTRDVIRGWLLRDLKAVPPPPATGLAERPSDRGERFRARLVADAESIALEGILNSDQARSWRKAPGRQAQPLLPGRGSIASPRIIDEDQPTADLAAELRFMLHGQPRGGAVFTALLGLGRYSPRLELPKEQQSLVSRLDELTVATIRAWLIRGLDEKTLARWSALAERITWSDRVLESLRAHAEALALEGILTPAQADRILSESWKSARLASLLDPQFAARLRLTKARQEQVCILLYGKLTLGMHHREAITRAEPPLETMPDGAARADDPRWEEPLGRAGCDGLRRPEQHPGARACAHPRPGKGARPATDGKAQEVHSSDLIEATA